MKHIKEFDGLRGLLALWVFVAHVIELGPYSPAAPRVHANWAVDIFIILSGFVIFHLLDTGEDWRTFLVRRWFRLFPTFAVCFLGALALYGMSGMNDPTGFGIGRTSKLFPYLATHAAMLHGAVPEQLLPRSAEAILPPAWSISVEWQFYLLAPLLFIFATRPNRAAALVFITLILLRIITILGEHGIGREITFDMRAFLPLRLESFAVGAGCYAIWRWLCARATPIQVPRLCYALLVPVWILAARKSPSIGMWLIGFALLVHFYFGNQSRVARLFPATLNGATIQFLGKISYCVYLLHVPVIILVREIIRRTSPTLARLPFECLLAISGLALTIAGSWLLHLSVEQPMIRFGKRLTKSWKSRVPVPVGWPTASMS